MNLFRHCAPVLFVLAFTPGCDKTPEAATPATPVKGDAVAGKALAKSCANCHGADGASARHGAPFIAGQRQDYMIHALQSYANGLRTQEEKKEMVLALGEKGITDVSAYYSTLSTPWKGAVKPAESKSRAFDAAVIAAGRDAAKSCDSCHGVNGNSAKPGIPSLAGLQPEYFSATLDAYAAGERTDPIMPLFKDAIDTRTSKILGAYYASLPRSATADKGSGNAVIGKALAAACAGCHGAGGNSINPTMPSLAGQGARYLEKSLLAYKSEQRKNAMMQSAAAKLKPDDMSDLSAYFAQQTPRGPGARTQAASGGFDPIGDGARLAVNCSGCHGAEGNSTLAGVPSLSRLHNEYLAAAIKAYRSGARKNETMKNFTGFLSEDDIDKLALYYATQTPAAAPGKSKGDAAAGERVAAGCITCHGEKGNSATPATPSLAGQDSVYLAAAINAYARGARAHKDMKTAASGLKEADIINVAAWFSAQTPVKPDVRLPSAPGALAQRCFRCHGENGYSTESDKPRLAGQYEPYLIQALRSYQTGARDNSMMHAMSDALSELEIRAIAEYFARK